jgi:hypothetical protein
VLAHMTLRRERRHCLRWPSCSVSEQQVKSRCICKTTKTNNNVKTVNPLKIVLAKAQHCLLLSSVPTGQTTGTVHPQEPLASASPPSATNSICARTVRSVLCEERNTKHDTHGKGNASIYEDRTTLPPANTMLCVACCQCAAYAETQIITTTTQT